MSKEIWTKIMQTRERRISEAQIGRLCGKCEQLQSKLTAADKQIGWLKGDNIRLRRSIEIRDNAIASLMNVYKSKLAAAEEQLRWIPVGEKLPEEGQKVDGYIEKLLLRIPDLIGDSVNGEKCITDSGGWQIEGLTHWRPIDLPKGERT